MVLRAPGDLGLHDVEQPTPDRDHVLVRVAYSGICGTDLKIYKGSIPVRHPLIMGHEMVGELDHQRVVVDPGLYCGACSCCRAGHTSMCPNGGLIGRDADGGFAEYVRAPRTHVFPLPDSISSRTAPLIQVLTTCLHGQRKVNIFPGQSVVVLGLGVTGLLHVQLAKERGAHPVIGISRSAWKRRLAEELGADITLASGSEAGHSADAVIESTGMMSSIAAAISMARPGATLLLFGISTAAEGALPFYQLYFKELTIVNSRAAKSEDFPASIDLVASGAVKLEPLVTHVIGLDELGTAIHMLESDTDRRMKIILENR
jgi:L-iditol 2-dehydrogenase